MHRKVLLGAYLALLSVSCGDDSSEGNTVDESSRRVYVGEVAGSDARVGVVQDDHAMRLFVCGGPSTLETFTRWFSLQGVPENGEFGGTNGDLSVAGEVENGRVSGSLTRSDGSRFDFEALRAHDELSGLFDGPGDCGKAGLIVDAEGTGEATGQGACLGTDGRIMQISPVRPIALDGQGKVAVRVGDNELALSPVIPQP